MYPALQLIIIVCQWDTFFLLPPVCFNLNGVTTSTKA